MSRINWARLVLGGIVAAIIMFVADGFIHGQTGPTCSWAKVSVSPAATL
ncbi:MAG TPA: hypothetical protein VM941_03290 [Pyrinomonadaceae bacterium]|nr:hypothetical protein [Pyrinomonadaceae bacterium]